jgi:hypothetical protein
LGIGRRLMGHVAAPLPVEVHGRIAPDHPVAHPVPRPCA